MISRTALLFLLATIHAAELANPPRLAYATYTGPEAGSIVYGLTADASANIYLAGARPDCAFLTKLEPTGATALWSICLPMGQVSTVQLDGAGSIYVAGPNQTQPSAGAPTSSTVLKLDPDASHVTYSTTIQGARATKLVVDSTHNVYLTGWADSTFAPTPGAYLTAKGASFGAGAFAAKLRPQGTIEYATYLDFLNLLGGTPDIAVDGAGQAWVVGASCPAPLTTCDLSQGTASAIRKLDSTGSLALFGMTFGGGPGPDKAFAFRDSALGVASDATGAVWVVGTAQTNLVPTTADGLQSIRPSAPYGLANGFGYALKLSSAGRLIYGTYLGTDPELKSAATAVTVDSMGQPHFPIEVGYPLTTMPLSAVTVLSGDGHKILVSRNLPAPVRFVALDNQGGLYVAGNTPTSAFLTTIDAYQRANPGGSLSGYAAKFDLTTKADSIFSSVLNAASLVPGHDRSYPDGAAAPGEIVTLFGAGLPSNPKVSFDGAPAPIVYSDSGQINAVVPFGIANASTTVIVHGAEGGFVLPVSPAVPALFTQNGTGAGPLAALNQDGGLNSVDNPASIGSVVSVYLSGAGTMSPPIADGQLGPLSPPFPFPALGVSAAINGLPSQVVFAGQAPGLIAGLVQVNVQIPVGVTPGTAQLTVFIGNYQTQLRATTIEVR